MVKKKVNILFIDDDQGFLDMVSTVIRSSGLTITKFSNSTKAMDAFRNNEYDIVLTDLQMPDMPGFEIINTIRKEKPDVNLIVISGAQPKDNQNMEEYVMGMGADYFFPKPLDLTELMRTINILMAAKNG